MDVEETKQFLARQAYGGSDFVAKFKASEYICRKVGDELLIERRTQSSPSDGAGRVCIMPGFTTLPVPVTTVLDGASDLVSVLVLGITENGEFRAASSLGGNGMESVRLASLFTHKYYAGDYG
jgi:hypothetical protein